MFQKKKKKMKIRVPRFLIIILKFVDKENHIFMIITDISVAHDYNRYFCYPWLQQIFLLPMITTDISVTHDYNRYFCYPWLRQIILLPMITTDNSVTHDYDR